MHWFEKDNVYGLPHEDTTEGHLASEPELDPARGSTSSVAVTAEAALAATRWSLTAAAVIIGVFTDGLFKF